MQYFRRLVRPDGVRLHDRLGDYRTYEKQIEHLHNKYLFTRYLYVLEQDEVSLASISMNARKVARLIAAAVGAGRYELGPARIKTIVVEGKERKVFSYRLLDLIVRCAITGIIQEAVAPLLSSQLYSYRKGVSWLAPAFEFASYTREHRGSRPNPKERGIYVLRRDVHAYTDTIPVGPESAVWQILREAFAAAGMGHSTASYDWRMIEQVVRPEVQGTDGSRFTPLRGIPTGQPIASVLYNLYLSKLDHELAAVPDGFYARYSDDILFAHPDPDVTRRAGLRIEQTLSELDLCLNPEKSLDLYLTAAGRPSSEWVEAKGTSSIQFVGARVSAAGTVALNRKKSRGLLRDIERRALRTAKALDGMDRDSAGPIVCSVINKALGAHLTPIQQRSASLARRAVTDRDHLAQLDYQIARIVLRALTGDSGVRAFRRIPYRKIREEWGLVSLLHARNQWGRN